MEFIHSDLGPRPGGHYSQAVVANGFVFVAGQLPLIAESDGKVPVGIEAQTRQALKNVGHILQAAGSGLDKLVSVTVYVTDIAHWPAVNHVYAEVLGDHRPARTVAVSPQLHFGCLVEIQATAIVPAGRHNPRSA
jgi:2-iminobutanoate/2-iminopropanoate deaminase